LDIALKKSKYFESNALEYHLVETKASGGHPVESLKESLKSSKQYIGK